MIGERCGRQRVARLMRQEGLRSQTGCRRRPGRYGGKPQVVSPNRLERQFSRRFTAFAEAAWNAPVLTPHRNLKRGVAPNTGREKPVDDPEHLSQNISPRTWQTGRRISIGLSVRA